MSDEYQRQQDIRNIQTEVESLRVQVKRLQKDVLRIQEYCRKTIGGPKY